MNENQPASPRTRKRGQVLLESIYDATLQIIRTQGYGNLTFMRVARLANTGRSVLYRRWATPFDLIREIMAYRTEQALGGSLDDMLRDTGSLRSDLLYLFALYQKIYLSVGPEIMNAMLFEMSQSNARIPTIATDIGFRNVALMRRLLGFAQARGEQTRPLSNAALTIPFDLIRMRFMWERRELLEAECAQIVDEVLLPVFLA
ncbi:MAG: TetR/AcrR family transcriptional regulator [Coriobacteriia bacterium]|nr:TetR/AcrR family transcriptional regulator [Coriobacteriia bacterium]